MKYNNYDSVLLKTKRLILNKGTIKDYLKVYEYDFKKLMCIDDMIEFEKEDEKKIKSWFNGGINKYFRKLVKAHMFDWIIYLDNDAIGNILTGDEDIENNRYALAYAASKYFNTSETGNKQVDKYILQMQQKYDKII